MKVPVDWPVHPNLKPDNYLEGSAEKHYMYPDYTYQDITGTGAKPVSLNFQQRQENSAAWNYSPENAVRLFRGEKFGNTGNQDDSFYPYEQDSNVKTSFLHNLKNYNIHDLATAVNLGLATANYWKGTPPPVTFQRPSAHPVQLDTSAIENAYRLALGSINTSQANLQKGTHSVGDVVRGAAFAGSQVLQAQNQATAQKVALENQVDAQNAQILNTVEAQRAQIGNEEEQLNVNLRYQDARLREEAVHSNLQSAFTNQLAKRQEQADALAAERNNLIQLEALKMAIEQDAFESDDFSSFRTNFVKDASSQVEQELGNINDVNNPIYKDVLANIDQDFESRYTPPDRLAGEREALMRQRQTFEGMEIEGKEALMQGLDEQLAGLEEKIGQDKTISRQVYQLETMASTAVQEKTRRLQERTSEQAIRDAYREKAGLPKSNMNALLTILNIKPQ